MGQQELNTPVVAQWSTHLPARWKTEARAPAIANAVSCPRQHNGYHCRFQKPFSIRGSIVVSISACHAEDPGSIPGRGGALLATEAGTGRARRRASVARVTARTVTCLADSALRAKSRCNMPAGTPARHAKIPGSIPGRGAQHAHAARRAGHGPRAVAHMGRPRHCCTPGTSALRPLL